MSLEWPRPRRLLAAVTTAALLVGGMAGFSPAQAVPVRSTGHACDPQAQQAAIAAGLRSTGRELDTPEYSVRQLRRIDRRLRRTVAAKKSAGVTLRSGEPSGVRLRIPVYVHVIQGNRPAQRGPSRRRVSRQLRILNRGYDGGESQRNTPTPFRFYLASFEKVRHAAWYHAAPDPVDKASTRMALQMRRRLHQGTDGDLNLYFSRPRSSQNGQALLGFSTMPWRAHRYPRLDGVTLNDASMRGGSVAGYNRGDTAVHEVGHWLGLFHTFAGGCSQRNDLVADTPAERDPQFRCDRAADSCTAPGKDPIHNFMDYSYDSCMNQFTHDQVQRMADNWLAYRTS